LNDVVHLNPRISMWGVSRVLPDHEYDDGQQRVRGRVDVRRNYFTITTPQVLHAVSGKVSEMSRRDAR
jgi:hypothetical protein